MTVLEALRSVDVLAHGTLKTRNAMAQHGTQAFVHVVVAIALLLLEGHEGHEVMPMGVQAGSMWPKQETWFKDGCVMSLPHVTVKAVPIFPRLQIQKKRQQSSRHTTASKKTNAKL